MKRRRTTSKDGTTQARTIRVDDELLSAARSVSGVRSNAKVVEVALRLLVERAARARLASLAGSVPRAVPAPRRPRGR